MFVFKLVSGLSPSFSHTLQGLQLTYNVEYHPPGLILAQGLIWYTFFYVLERETSESLYSVVAVPTPIHMVS